MRTLIRVVLAATMFCLICCASPLMASAEVRYTVTDLMPLLGGYAYGLNDNGAVVGRCVIGSEYHAALYDGTVHDLDTVSGWSYTSIATGINDNGRVVGQAAQASYNGDLRAFLYDGTMHDLGTLGGRRSSAEAINSRGETVGWAEKATGNSHAFLYDGTMHDLGTLGGATSSATAINDSGVVVGAAETSPGSAMHAFCYDGTMHDLGVLRGYSDSWAYGINSSGVIVGDLMSDRSHAFFYDGTLHDLGTLSISGYVRSEAMGINDSGLIVGSSSMASGFSRAIIYDGTKMLDLNTLIAPSSGWRLATADAINNTGQILCYGYDSTGAYHPLLLTPSVPEPSSLLALLAGTGSVGTMLRRRAK